MKPLKVALLAIAGVVLPLALAAAAVLISSGVGASTPIAPLPAGQKTRGGTPSLSSTPEGSLEPSTSPSAGSPSATPSVDDQGGRCSEPEHSNDPSCDTPRDDGSSGSGGHGSGGGDD